MADEEDDYTDETLDATPTRVTQFLYGLGAEPGIRTAMFELGNMTTEDITEGRDLLILCFAAPVPASADPLSPDAKKSRASAAFLDQWDEGGLARYGAALKRKHLPQWSYVFDGGALKASTGADAIAGVQTFLARVTALETGSDPARAGSKVEDAAAVALLTKRGLTPEVRASLSEHVNIALGPTAPVPTVVTPEERHDRLVALRAWFDEWSAVARAVIKKRAHLIRLGLASRRPSEKKEDPKGGGGGVSGLSS